MVFKVGKYYRHNGGGDIHIIGKVKTMMRGKGLLAEGYGRASELFQVGMTEDNAVNWYEISKKEWEMNFKEKE